MADRALTRGSGPGSEDQVMSIKGPFAINFSKRRKRSPWLSKYSLYLVEDSSLGICSLMKRFIKTWHVDILNVPVSELFLH